MRWKDFLKANWYFTKITVAAFIVAYAIMIPMGIFPAMMAASPFTGAEFIIRWAFANGLIMVIMIFFMSIPSLFR